jgi:hypothetical protein
MSLAAVQEEEGMEGGREGGREGGGWRRGSKFSRAWSIFKMGRRRTEGGVTSTLLDRRAEVLPREGRGGAKA